VRPEHVAWCAPGANSTGYHLEHAGFARQTRADWLDAYSLAMLKISARHARKVCDRYSIPVRWLSHDDLAETIKQELQGYTGLDNGGFCGHADVNTVWAHWQEYGLPPPKEKSTHTDPGNGYPTDVYIDLVQKAA